MMMSLQRTREKVCHFLSIQMRVTNEEKDPLTIDASAFHSCHLPPPPPQPLLHIPPAGHYYLRWAAYFVGHSICSAVE